MTNVQRVQLQPAYVIHQRPFRDTSAIVEIFSQAHGRHSLVAKGLKRPKSKFRGLLQPFQPLLISWVSKSDLGTLIDAEMFSHPPRIKAKYLPSAFYLNELILHLLQRDDPHDDLFAAYHQTLVNLQQLNDEQSNDLRWQAYLRMFELALLQSIGYGLVLDQDVDNHLPVEPGLSYDYVIDHGPVKMNGGSSHNNAIQVSGEALLMLHQEEQLLEKSLQVNNANKVLFSEVKRLLRTVIDIHLGHKTLHSREMFMNIDPGVQAHGEDAEIVEKV